MTFVLPSDYDSTLDRIKVLVHQSRYAAKEANLVEDILRVGSTDDELTEVLRSCGRALGWLVSIGGWELDAFAVWDFLAYDHFMAYPETWDGDSEC
jgi:hypothetical protein